MPWQPSASFASLQFRARLLASIREFFLHRQVLEVDTPVLGAATVTDPSINSIQAAQWFLQTSPEYAMKRLLAAGIGSIYQLAKVFRAEEMGRLHNAEFTLLEWYRPGFDHLQLMQEITELLRHITTNIGGVCKPIVDVNYLSYRDAFQNTLGIDPHTIGLQELKQLACNAIDTNFHSDMTSNNKNLWLQLLLNHLLEPELAKAGPTFLFDYPASQAALSKLATDSQGQLVAQRFELYIDGIEVANGYHELLDAQEQERRFQQDIKARLRQGQEPVTIDSNFMAAMQHGLPPCAGVAIGIERLQMVLTQAQHIKDVIAFTSDRA